MLSLQIILFSAVVAGSPCVAERDPAGYVTEFEYDEVGRLTKVIDAMDGETTYTYDELGNRLTQTDAEGRITTMEYDALGHGHRPGLLVGQQVRGDVVCVVEDAQVGSGRIGHVRGQVLAECAAWPMATKSPRPPNA